MNTFGRSAQEQRKYESLHYPSDAEQKVLINKASLTTPSALEHFERTSVSARLKSGLPGEAKEQSVAGLKALHGHLFQDVYEWAGTFREYTTGRNTAPFAVPEYIEPSLVKIFDELNKELDTLRTAPTDVFAERTAYYVNEINAIHPFVEGNGRTQRVWLRTFAQAVGRDVIFRQGDRDKWYEASRTGFYGDNTRMTTFIGERVVSEKDRIHTPNLAVKQLSPFSSEREKDTGLQDLTGMDLKRYTQSVALLDETFTRAHSMLENRDAAERAPVERKLSQMMYEFTTIDPNTAYAQDLQKTPNANTIYMHGLSDRAEVLQSREVQQMFMRLEQEHGLSAAALTARLEIGADTRYLELLWGQDDLTQVAAHHGLSLDTPAEREQAVTMLSDAYEAARVVLVSERVLDPLPLQAPTHTITSPEHEATVQTTDHGTDRADPYSDDNGYGRER